MNRKKLIFGVSLLFFLTISSIGSPVQAAQELEWKVEVGDSKTYEVLKYYDEYLLDFDGDPDLENKSVGDEFYIYEKGTTVEVTITALNGVAEVDEVFNGDVTVENELGTNPQGTAYVIMTIDNETYVDEMLPEDTETITMTREGDLVVTVGEMPWLFDPDVTWEYEYKINWKTGWIEYMYQKLANSTDTLTEVEYAVKGSSAPGFELPIIVFGIFVATIVASRKRR